MRKFLFYFFVLILVRILPAQIVTEKEVFSSEYKGNIDLYSFIYDEPSGNFCYSYFVENENKYFIISKKALSEKYDFVNLTEVLFDSKGNYYAVTGDYKKDYGIDNHFLIVNGKTELNFPFIDSYSSSMNKDDEFMFIFKQFDKYKLGYYSVEKGFRESIPYDMLKSIYIIDPTPPAEEDGGDHPVRGNFYKDENGERGFVAIADGKAKLIFGTKEILTDFSDVNEGSLTKNNNSELVFVAKRGGNFYEGSGNEFVVSGGKEYKSFGYVNPPIFFNENNEPVYSAGDSIGENVYDTYLVIADERQQPYMRENSSQKTPRFGYGITELKIDKGSTTYFGFEEIRVPGQKTKPGEEVYDQYYNKAFMVNNGMADELGYNTGKIIYCKDGQMLFSGISDLNKKEYLLMQSNGVSKIILNRKIYNGFPEYGLAPDGQIYYIGQNYDDPSKNIKYEADLFIGDELIGNYEYIVPQYINNTGSTLKFDSKNNYAYVAGERIDSITYHDYVYTNKGRVPLPKSASGKERKFNYITGLMYSKSDKLFYLADMRTGSDKTEAEIFVDNVPVKTYDAVGEPKYDPIKDQVNFFAAKNKKVYNVTVQF